MMIQKSIGVLFAGVLFVMIGCQSSTTTQRLDPQTIIDIGNNWNDTDSRLVAEEMIDDALNRPWLRQYQRRHEGRNPVVIVGCIQDRSRETINTNTFIQNLQTELTNSGEVAFVANKHERDDIRDEQVDQASHASEETAKQAGEEIGADYQLQGVVNSITTEEGDQAVKFYQINLSLIDIKTGEKVWIGEKKIKKLITR